MLNFDSIPQELKSRKQFVLHADGKRPFFMRKDKPVYAGWQKPANQISFDDAIFHVDMDDAHGVSFCFNGDGFYGIDLDRVVIDGSIIPEAQAILDTFADCAYIERSMSGEGFHIICQAFFVDMLGGKNNRKKLFLKYDPVVAGMDASGKPILKNRQIEIYQSRSNFALTGDVCDFSLVGDDTFPDMCEELQALYAQYWGELKNDNPTDDSVIKPKSDADENKSYFEVGLEKDPILNAVWNRENLCGDESADDLTFFNKLAYWCNCDADLMLELAFSSPFYGGKDENHTRKWKRIGYLNETIEKAIAGTAITAKQSDVKYKNKQAASDFKGVMTTIRASDILPKEVEWLWGDVIIRGALNSIQGMPGVGKTFLLCALCAAVSTGQKIQSVSGSMESIPRGSVLYLSGDDEPGIIVSRLKSMFDADLNAIHFAPGGALPVIGSDAMAQLFESTRPALVVLDTLQHFMDGKTDSNSANSATAAISPLKLLAEKYNAAVVVVQHINKQSASGNGGNSVSFGIGSSAINGLFRSVWTLGRVKENGNPTIYRAVAPSKTNYVVGDPPAIKFELSEQNGFVWAGTDGLLTAEALYDIPKRNNHRPRDLRDDVKGKILELLQIEPMPAAELKTVVIEETGCSPRTFDSARAELTSCGSIKIKKHGAGWLASLNREHFT